MKILGLDISRARERKASATWPGVTAIYSGRDAVYTPRDYAALSKAGYQMCAHVYAAVSLIARACAGIKWTVGKKQSDGTLVELEAHPLLDLLAAPNEYDSGYRLVESITSYKLLAGNSYVEKAQGLKSAPPRFLYALRPDRMTIKPGDAKGLVAAYTYEVNGKKIKMDTENLLHLKDFHPLNDFYGLSRLEVAAKAIDISNSSQEWNLKNLQNDMRLSGLLVLKGMTDAQSKKIQEQMRDRYAGAENAGKMMVLENIEQGDFKPFSMTPKDADWGESEKRNLRVICSVFNIWSGLLGDSENTTYANYQEGRKALYQETVLPEMDGLTSAFNRWLVPSFGDGVVLGYDRDAIEALQEDREKKYAYLASASWLTVNEKRIACGYDEIPEGDVVMVGMGEMPLGDAVAPAGELTEDEDDDKDEGDDDAREKGRKSLGGFWRGEAERKALWQSFERRVAAKERAFKKELSAFLARQAEGVISKVRLAPDPAAIPQTLLDKKAAVQEFVERFAARYRKLYATALQAGRNAVEGKLYDFTDDEKADGGWVDEATRRKLEKLIEESAEVITDETLSEIQAVMRDSLGANLTVQEIAGALQDKLVDTMAPVRARRIARTETAMLENAGSLDGFKENEFVSRKMWVCSFVEDSRDSHKEASGQEVGIDDPFRVGSALMQYPGDRSGGADAGEVVNCLCYIAPIVE